MNTLKLLELYGDISWESRNTMWIRCYLDGVVIQHTIRYGFSGIGRTKDEALESLYNDFRELLFFTIDRIEESE